MTALENRLRRVLSPRYTVEGEISTGGMAHVFAGRDPALDRRVAIKVLRPEFATAGGAHRFLREARIIARLGHPNVIPVHEVGEAEGLYYYVMDYVAGETLRERVARGPLGVERALRVGTDLLAALRAAHERGVIHRDVKPGNVFLVGERALLGDFGIAKVDTTDESLTTPGHQVGTPGYMAPEQVAGEEVTPRTDLYCAAMVVYEALTGRKWPTLEDPGATDWSGVHPPIARALKRALARSPAERWPDAARFREALLAAVPSRARRARGRGAVALAAGLAAAVAGTLLFLALRGGDGAAASDAEGRLYDLAILPCETIPRSDSAIGTNLALLVNRALGGVPGSNLAWHVTAFRWWLGARAGGDPDPAAGARALNARWAADCDLSRSRDSLVATVWLVNAEGERNFVGSLRGPAVDPPQELGRAVAVEIMRALPGMRAVSSEALSALTGHDVDAVLNFLWGEDAFIRNEKRKAEEYYLKAARADPGMAIAWWRLADVRRWLSEPPGVDLTRLYRESADHLASEVDRLLLQARIAGPWREEYAIYEAILRRYPHDAYAALIYGDELLHRGPLAGIPLDSAETVLRLAAEKDPFLAPAHEHLVLLQIRLGRRQEAATTLAHLEAISAQQPPEAVTLFHPALLQQAYLERFAPDSAAARRDLLFGPGVPGVRLLLAEAARFGGPYLDLPDAQLELGSRLVAAAGPDAAARVSGHLARAAALAATGRWEEALSDVDRAGTLTAAPVGRLQAAEWRVVPAALGLAGPPPASVLEGRAALERSAEDAGLDPWLRARAAWTLALLAHREGDAPAFRRWRREVAEAAGGGEERLVRFLEALEEAEREDFARALRHTSPLVAAEDSVADLRFPFSRAVLYLKRGEWFEGLQIPDSARAAWLWYENSDLDGVPGAVHQAGEVDWALGTHGRLFRARTALAAGLAPEACRLAAEAAGMWERADPPLGPLREEARAVRDAACPR